MRRACAARARRIQLMVAQEGRIGRQHRLDMMQFEHARDRARPDMIGIADGSGSTTQRPPFASAEASRM